MSSVLFHNVPATILINNYNYGQFLKETIDSALSQTYKNLEVIVVGDGSTDNSREVIQSYSDRIGVSTALRRIDVSRRCAGCLYPGLPW